MPQRHVSSQKTPQTFRGDRARQDVSAGEKKRGSQRAGITDSEMQAAARQSHPSDKNQAKAGGSGKYPKYDRMA